MSYKELEALFMAQPDALCENKPPRECNCAVCPCKELCDALCAASNAG